MFGLSFLVLLLCQGILPLHSGDEDGTTNLPIREVAGEAPPVRILTFGHYDRGQTHLTCTKRGVLA